MLFGFCQIVVPPRVCLGALVLGTIFMAGCSGSGPKLAQVEGTVTLDGKPLANKSLMFTPIEGTEGNGAGGSSDAAGKYTLNAMISGATRDYPGIAPGRYRVTVFDATISGDASMQDEGDEPAVAVAPGMASGTSEIPRIYGTDQSPLILDVPESGGKLDVELKSNPGR
jgi:hypothetical protein